MKSASLKSLTRTWALAPVLALSLGLAACGGEVGAQDLGELEGEFAALDDLYDEAVAAGEKAVVIYGTTVEEKDALIDVFESRYPEIKVQTVRLLGANLSAKVQQEVAAKRVEADLVLAGASSHARHAAQGWYADPELVGIDDLPDAVRAPQEHAIAPSSTVFGIAYDANDLAAEEAPRGWADLVSPDWKGRLGLIDPNNLNGTTVTMSYLRFADVVDESWMAGLSGQDARIVGEGTQLGESLATGKVDAVFGYPLSYAFQDNERGADIGYVFPTEGGSILAPEYVALLKDAPHSQAATLFLNWLFTPEAQETFAEIGEFPSMPGSPTPEGMPARDEIDNLVDLPDGVELGRLMEETVALTGKYF